MDSLGITNGYSLNFKTDQYFLESYWENLPIDYFTLSDWRMYSRGDLVNEFKLINLVNYLKSKKYSWDFSFSDDWTCLKLNWSILTDVFKFDDIKYKKLDASHKKNFIAYLNRTLNNS